MFDLFEDPAAATRALSRQPDARLDGLLASLRESRRVSDDGCRKADQIVNILRNQGLPSPAWDMNWFLHLISSSDVGNIAEKLDQTISSRLFRFEYTDWACWALGYHHDGISVFCDALANFRNEIGRLRQTSPSDKWALLEEVPSCDSV